jgi:hypothetical protein
MSVQAIPPHQSGRGLLPYPVTMRRQALSVTKSNRHSRPPAAVLAEAVGPGTTTGDHPDAAISHAGEVGPRPAAASVGSLEGSVAPARPSLPPASTGVTCVEGVGAAVAEGPAPVLDLHGLKRVVFHTLGKYPDMDGCIDTAAAGAGEEPSVHDGTNA